ncbi:MAG: phenylalanine--tRNA ligase subunit alpha, partial [Eubacteriales bacterium]
MKEKLVEILARADAAISAVDQPQKLEELRVAYLGKKGELTAILRGMGALSPEERPVIGAKANEVRAAIEARIAEASERIKKNEAQLRLAAEKIDVTVPGAPVRIGSRHPLTLVRREIESIFTSMGFSIAEGPEVEFGYYNFDALNTPANHPARDVQDTFYFSENML